VVDGHQEGDINKLQNSSITLCHNLETGSTLPLKVNENLNFLSVEISEAAIGTVFPYTMQFCMCVSVHMCSSFSI
jgi:hypothetical protein